MRFKSVILCLATEKGFAVVDSLTPSEDIRFAICTFRETNVSQCYHDRIRDRAIALGIPLIDLTRWRSKPLEVIEELDADAIICVGWRYLIPPVAASRVQGNVIVAHDSLLPKYRGFAPLVTALLCGDDRAGVTFLRAGVTVDDGPIYWQRAVDIHPADTIATVISRLLPLYVAGVHAGLEGFGDPIEQDVSQVSYSIWRDSEDFFLDWSNSADFIHRMVRAMGIPYLGAKTYLGTSEVTILRGAALPDLNFAIRQPGKVWSLDSVGRPHIICGSGLYRIDEAVFADGTSLIPMERLRVRFDRFLKWQSD